MRTMKWLGIVVAACAAPLAAQTATPPQGGEPVDDGPEIVVTGRGTGAPLAGGEWEFKHSAVVMSQPRATGIAAVPVNVEPAKKWRFCLPTSPVEDLLKLLLVRGSDGEVMGNCSRMTVKVMNGRVRSNRSCAATYYPPVETVASGPRPFATPQPDTRLAGAPLPVQANRQFVTVGEFGSANFWLRFDAEIRLPGATDPVQRVQSTLTARRLGDCAVDRGAAR